MPDLVSLRKEKHAPGVTQTPSETPRQEPQMDDGGDPRQVYRCRACRLVVCQRGHRTQVNGTHTHTFANPHGVVFEIGCFRDAPGCHQTGPAYDDFSWFSGYRWRISVCGGCGSHLGWMFVATTAPAFFGLILERLVEDRLAE